MNLVRRPTAVFLAAAAGGVAFSFALAWGHPVWSARWGMLWRLGLWCVCWVVAVAAALRLPRKRALVLIIGAGVALRIAALAGPPTTSDDLYRYSWDGRVQQAGIDPYAAAPASAQLEALRPAWLWPGPSVCAQQADPPGCTRINRPKARTIYPPVAEAWFAAVYRVTGIGARHKAWQAAGVVTELTTMVVLAVALRRWERDPRWTALYALSPFAALELVNNAHVDGLAIALLVGALAVAAPAKADGERESARGDVLLGLLIGAAALVKVYPAVVLLAVPCLPRARPFRSMARASAAAAALVLAVYLPHVLATGTRVVGYLPGYLREERYRGGGRFLVAGLLHLPGPIVTAVALAGMLGAVAWVWWRRPPFTTGAAVLLAAMFLTTSPVQPWYAVSLLAVAAADACPWWALVTAAGYPYFFAVVLANGHAAGVGQAAYTAALVAMLLATRVRGRHPTPLARAVAAA